MKLLFSSFLVALGPLLVAADQLRFANPSTSSDPITSFSSSTGRVLNSQNSKVKLSEINSPDGFTTLEHEEFPSHSIRIKETTVSALRAKTDRRKEGTELTRGLNFSSISPLFRFCVLPVSLIGMV